MHLTLTLCLLSALVISVTSNTTCMSLQGSKLCKTFSDFKIPINPTRWLRGVLDNPQINLPDMLTIQDFDNMMKTYIPDISSYITKSLFGCDMKEGERYRLTVACAAYIYVSNNPQSPDDYKCSENYATVCKQSVNVWHDSIVDTARNPSICPNSTDGTRQTVDNIESLRRQFLSTDWLSGTPPNCADAELNEAERCGYVTDDIAKRHSCNVSTASSSSNLPLIIGLSAGGVLLFAGVIFGVIFYRRNKPDPETDPKLDFKQLDTPDFRASMSTLPGGAEATKTLEEIQRLSSLPQSPKTQPHPTDMSQGVAQIPLQPGTVYVATGAHVLLSNPNEIAVQQGDSMLVKQILGNGWAGGVNLTRQIEGVFPLSVFVSLSSGSSTLSNPSVSTLVTSPTSPSSVPSPFSFHPQSQSPVHMHIPGGVRASMHLSN